MLSMSVRACSRGAGSDVPFSKGGGTEVTQGSARDEMALDVEGVVDSGMSRQEALGRPRVLESQPRSLSSSHGLV